jgi:MFS family permease
VVVESDIAARLDRLPWSRWHLQVVIALGVSWLLDGLEVTIVGSLGSVLEEPGTLHLTAQQVGVSATAYLGGAILGALLFGYLTDRHGRKRLFMLTLSLYLLATIATALATGRITFTLFRFLTGMGIGGECAAMNSAIDELLPARVRGTADLAVNGTYWIGAALGAAASIVLLEPRVLGHRMGWRACFAIGAVLGLAILLVRRYVPESPRWLLVHGRTSEAEAVVREIEQAVEHGIGRPLPPASGRMRIRLGTGLGLREVAGTLLVRYRERSLLGFVLMVTQAFFYNAIFFTYALVLSTFYGVPSGHVGYYVLPFALGNALGPIVIGRLFDSVGRRQMIALTYAVSGTLLACVGFLFGRGWLTATTQTLLWSGIFFVASAAASSAYLTVSEVFPLELRAIAIALFYAVGTAAGGLIAPAVFGGLIGSGRRVEVEYGYLLGAVLMLVGAAFAWRYGVAAERRSLEDVARPLSDADAT